MTLVFMAHTDHKGSVLLLKAPPDSSEDKYVETLEHAGYRAVLVPVLSFNFINQDKLVMALCNAHDYAGIVFTSVRAVQAVIKALADNCDVKHFDPHGFRCFVVGQATAEAAREAQFDPEGADTGNAEKLAQFILDKVDKHGERSLLFPCGQMRQDTLLNRLQSADCKIEEITAYETVASDTIQKDILSVFNSEETPHSVVYFSPSGVQFTERFVTEGVLPLSSMKVYALGPSTQQAIVSRGYNLTAVAAKPSPASLLQLLLET